MEGVNCSRPQQRVEDLAVGTVAVGKSCFDGSCCIFLLVVAAVVLLDG